MAGIANAVLNYGKTGKSAVLELVNLSKNDENLRSLLQDFVSFCRSIELKLVATALRMHNLNPKLAKALQHYIEGVVTDNAQLQSALVTCRNTLDGQMLNQLAAAMFEFKEAISAAAEKETQNWTKYGTLKTLVAEQRQHLNGLDEQFEKTHAKVIDLFQQIPTELQLLAPDRWRAKWFWLSIFGTAREVTEFAFTEAYKKTYGTLVLKELTTNEATRLQEVLVNESKKVRIDTFAKAAKDLGFPFDLKLSSGKQSIPSTTSSTLVDLVGIDSASEFAEKARESLSGTRVWLYKKIKAWYKTEGTDAASTVFVLLGKAGVGKTTILAELCRASGAVPTRPKRVRADTELLKLPLRVVAMHVFQHYKAKTQNPAKVIWSISYQLGKSIEGFVVDEPPSEGEEELSVLFDELIIKPSRRVPSDTFGQRIALIVIDALDECLHADRQNFVEVIQHRWGMRHVPGWLKLIISSRDKLEIPDRLRAFKPTILDQSRAENEEDLLTYFDVWLRDNELPEDELAHAKALLLARSEGLFLYVQFLPTLLRWILEEKKCLSLTTLKDEVPANLNVFYQSYFGRILKHCFEKDYDQYAAILGPIVYSRSPIPLDVLRGVCGNDCGDEYSKRSFVLGPLAKTSDVLNVVLDTNGDAVRFIHKSMRDFLCSEEDAGTTLMVSPQKSHAILAAWCLKEENLTNEFSLENVIYHAVNAKASVDAIETLLCSNYEWLALAVNHAVNKSRSLSTLWLEVEDNQALHPDCHLVARALRLSAQALWYDWRQLPAQLYHRLPSKHSLSALCLSQREQYAGLWPVGKPGKCLISAESQALGILRGHTNSVYHVCFSPDGTKIASCSYDETVRLWSVSEGKLLQTLDGHTSRVYHVCFSPDGAKIASCSYDKTVRLWSVSEGQLLSTSHEVYGVCPIGGSFRKVLGEVVDNEVAVDRGSIRRRCNEDSIPFSFDADGVFPSREIYAGPPFTVAVATSDCRVVVLQEFKSGNP